MLHSELKDVFSFHPQDPDVRRRVTFNIIDGSFPQASSTTSLVFSLNFVCDTKFISTVDTVVPFSRIDNGATVFNAYLYLRRQPIGTLPLVNIPYFEGGVARSDDPITSVQGCVQTALSNTIYNSSTLAGINGWKLADIIYNIDKKASDDLLSGKRLPILPFDPANPVIQMAMVVGSADTNLRITGHVHVDAIEVIL